VKLSTSLRKGAPEGKEEGFPSLAKTAGPASQKKLGTVYGKEQFLISHGIMALKGEKALQAQRKSLTAPEDGSTWSYRRTSS